MMTVPLRRCGGQLFAVVALIGLSAASALADETFYVDRGATWRYFRGQEEASSPVSAWRANGFNDDSWDIGPAPFGYGDPPFGTDLSTQNPPMRSNYSTVFLRREFTVTDASAVAEFRVNIDYDDGFAMWINGTRVLRINVNGDPGDPLTYDGFAQSNHESGTYENFQLPDPDDYLVDGVNVLAVMMFNVSLTSSDLKFDVELFDPFGPDLTPPAVNALVPAAGTTIRSLSQIEVTFSEEVDGVSAGDLIVNGAPASSVTGSGSGPYIFAFSPAPAGSVTVAWDASHGITDVADPPNAFTGTGWSYTVDPDAPEAEISITEFLASNVTGLRDEDSETSDWVEFENTGSTAVDLNGFSVTDDPDEKGKWVFPSRILQPGERLVVFASAKDRARPAGALHLSFKLSVTGEYLGLYSADSPRRVIAEFAPFPQQRPDISYGLDGTGNAVYLEPPTPGESNATSFTVEGLVRDPFFSKPAGFYTDPFQLEIASGTEGATVYYTLDGREPTTSSTRYTGPIQVAGTPSRAAVTVRAAAFKSGLLPSNSVTRTYIYLEHVRTQPNDPDGFPDSWGNAPAVDYEMDPQVVNDPAYTDLLMDGFNDIPTISIVMNTNDMFGSRGIYSNPGGDGQSWERACSAELIYPDGREGFQINCGIRIQGGASRNPSKSPKHSLRFLFKGAYGPSKLRFPFFPDSAVEVFDTISLRANYNNSWIHWDSGQRSRGSMIRDQWVRDAQLATSDLTSHGIHAHVFVNGLYWGVYNPVERPSAPFAAAHLGGEKEEYDALNSASPVDGNSSAWNAFMSFIGSGGFDSTAKYLQAWDYLDVDHFIDYMIINFFGSNADWPSHNWYAVRKRAPEGRWYFISWDAERIFEGVTANRTGAGDNNSPGIVHQRLSASAEYRLLFGDHVHRHFFGNGALTPTRTEQRWMARARDLDAACVAESARWGDYRRDVHSSSNGPYEFYRRNSHWLPEQNRLVKDYFPRRTAVVLAQFKSRNLYPSVDAPVFNRQGGTVAVGFELTMTHSGSGTIYYTTDGTDPRVFGSGDVSAAASSYSGPIVIDDHRLIKARVLSDGSWSALNEASFSVFRARDALRITELNYNPPTGVESEFVEIHNTVDFTIDLSGVQFTNGISYTFPPGSAIGPGGYIVLVADAAAFSSVYPGVEVDGEFTGSLGNGGERITLVDESGSVIDSLVYDDERLWPIAPDGFGFTLVLEDLNNEPSLPRSWRASSSAGGSPGSPDPAPRAGGVVIHEVLSRSEAPFEDAIELYNPTDASIDIGGWYLSDSRATTTNLLKFRIPDGTIVPPGGFAVFYESDFNSPPDAPTSFALSSSGDDVYLTATSGNDDLTGYITGHAFDASENGRSFGRHPVGGGVDFSTLLEPTFGVDNPATLEEFRSGTGGGNAAPWVGPVVINEIHYNPASSGIEFVELFNTTGSDVALFNNALGRGWQINGLRNEPGTARFEFAPGTVIPAGGYLLVVPVSPSIFRLIHAIPPEVEIAGPYSGGLDNGGERLKLAKPIAPDGGAVSYSTTDQVRYDDEAPWHTDPDGNGPTLERVVAGAYGNDPFNWERSLDFGGTPGGFNSVSDPNINQRPRASFVALPMPDEAKGLIFDAAESSDPDGAITTWSWEFGDGQAGSGVNVSHIYAAAGVYTVRLLVTDNEGASATTERSVTISEPPVGGRQVPGDSNQDGRLDITDVVSLLRRLFGGAAAPLPCDGAALNAGGNRRLFDVNADDIVNVADGVYVLNHLFQSGPQPVRGSGCVLLEGCPHLCAP